MVSNADKIMSLADLKTRVDALKQTGKTVVHCHGVFDLLHIGHIRYFEHARRMGEVLIVTLTPDRYVDKGPHRPAFSEKLRAEAIASLNCVDWVAINEWPTAEETLRMLRPHYYVKGSEFRDTSSDMTGKIGMEARVIEEIGATLAFTDDIVFSSSNLINRYLSQFPEEITQYLSLFRKRHGLDEILAVLDSFANTKVLVVGDAIVDEYQYCDAIGKSSKDPVLAMMYRSHESFAGGAMAVANHVANFAGEVQLLTVLGERHTYEDFIRSRLRENVTPHFVIKPGGHTCVKRRFLDGYSLNKLFEIYVMDDEAPSPDLDVDICAWLDAHLSEFDVVIAADFGHKAISEPMIQALTTSSPFLAAMTQANAGNRGFHTISRYPKADYVCLAEHEVRLETRNLHGNLRPMIESLADMLKCGQFVVTRGQKGCMVWDSDMGIIEMPAFAHKVVDRIGAGDAFLSVTALAAHQGVSPEVLGFLGNVVGALAVGIVGNVKAIDRMATKKYITSLMK